MSWYPASEPRRPGSGPWRAAGKRPFGATWWGQAWVNALEQRARLDPNRLPRGRTYARTGAVGELEVHAGEIVAAVQGSRVKPYRVTVRVRTYSAKEWERTLAALASQVGHLAALLDGEMPPGVGEDLAAAGIDLLPVAGEVQPRCSCPDWAEPCKHAAAVCYLVADTLDADPFLLFLMRGRDRDSLLAGLRAKRAADSRGGASAVTERGRGKRGKSAVGAAGGPDPGTDGGGWASDEGVAAHQAWARWATVSAAGAPPVPAIPMPPHRPGRPTVLAVDPPAGSGFTAESLRQLAADAVQRASELARGARSTGMELSAGEDLARRAAMMLAPNGLDGSEGAIGELARAAGIAQRELFLRALAWRWGAGEGLFVLSESWDPPRDETAVGRALLGGPATIRRNRVSLGERQLRLGRDRQWYPFRRWRGGWAPDGEPLSQ